MRTIEYNEKTPELLKILEKGAFLTTKSGERLNAMTIGWGSVGYSWGKPIFMAMVRKSRYTYDLLEQSREFTVSFPTDDAKAAIGVCGSKSGRDIDKFSACGLKTLPSTKIDTPVLDIQGIHFECKVLYQNDMLPNTLVAPYEKACYPNGDHHVLYFAEIVASYVID
jgi:flavin reductase (DIM6/NTAB) family NADH-FMN oxidoreductase RutF